MFDKNHDLKFSIECFNTFEIIFTEKRRIAQKRTVPRC